MWPLSTHFSFVWIWCELIGVDRWRMTLSCFMRSGAGGGGGSGGGVLLPQTAPLIPLPSSHMMWVIGSFISVNWWTNFSLLEVNWSTTTDEWSISRSRHPGRWLSTTRMPERSLWADLAQFMISIRHHCISQNILMFFWHLNLNKTGWRQLKIQLLITTIQVSSISLHGGFQVMWHFIPLILRTFRVALFILNILTGIFYSALSRHVRSTLSAIDWRTHFRGKITKGINHKMAALQQGMSSQSMKWFTEVVGKYWLNRLVLLNFLCLFGSSVWISQSLKLFQKRLLSRVLRSKSVIERLEFAGIFCKN